MRQCAQIRSFPRKRDPARSGKTHWVPAEPVLGPAEGWTRVRGRTEKRQERRRTRQGKLMRYAHVSRRLASSSHFARFPRVYHRGSNADAKAAVADVLKFDILFAPDKLKCAHGCPTRLRFALLQLVDRALRQANAESELAL